MTIEEAIEITKADQECHKHVLNCINEGDPKDCESCEFYRKADDVEKARDELLRFAEEHMRKEAKSKEYRKQYYKKNQERINERQRKYNAEHKEKISEYNHLRNLEHWEEKAKYNREYYRRKKDEQKAGKKGIQEKIRSEPCTV